jgi:hypothetical protein
MVAAGVRYPLPSRDENVMPGAGGERQAFLLIFQPDKFTFIASAHHPYSHLFTLFWVNKIANIFDANHYI